MTDADEPGSPAEDAAQDDRRTDARGTGRRITFWIGIGLILAGLGLLGYVAWQFWGTNWVSKRHQREITSSLEKAWASGHGKKPRFVPTGQASALIRIPKFGRKYVVPVLEGAADGTISADILAQGYGHFQSGGVGGAKVAYPGDVGNYAVAAHRVTHGEPLRNMPDLRPGDKVIVETVDATYTYVLDTNPNDLVIPFTGVWVLDPLPHNPTPGGPEPKQVQGQRLITLTTCSEIFHTDNRMIAFGHLLTVTSKAPAKASMSSAGKTSASRPVSGR
ncbi:MAG TPA: class E sortase [Marmoricola sp.]|nr:class E sortase [Marmoricola sp.]